MSAVVFAVSVALVDMGGARLIAEDWRWRLGLQPEHVGIVACGWQATGR
jgi:hypothetical protein